MDELNPFREFRSGAAPPSEQARQRASARLARAIDLERSLERAVAERPARVGVMSWVMKRRSYVGLAFVALAGAAAAALFLSAPWNDSSGFLAKARAALSVKRGVLHVKWVDTYTPTTQGCTVTRTNEIWMDETPPYRYRGFLQGYPPPAPCSRGTKNEVGGTTDPMETFVFEPPNKLAVQAMSYSYLDLTDFVLGAIDQGRAHDEGDTQLDGRTVRRIRIESPFPTYFYVDPETFMPVEIRAPALHGGPTPNAKVTKVADTVQRFLVYEYLPRTAANIALTDIRAQHPNATGP
jgi:hypothetical protein